MLLWARMTALLLITMRLAACTAPTRESADPFGAAPTDFSVEVSVLTGANVTATAAHLRQSRYLVFADGSLYAGADVRREKFADWLPPLTRVLTRRQVAELWSLAQQLGLTNPQASIGAVNFKLIQPGPDEVASMATLRGWGERWSFVRVNNQGSTDPAMTEFVRALAALAWMGDATPAQVRILPKRYDFGPEPYERFRQPGGAPAAAVATGTRP